MAYTSYLLGGSSFPYLYCNTLKAEAEAVGPLQALHQGLAWAIKVAQACMQCKDKQGYW